jgi:N-acetyl-anhydromuramyl-L-alanine amidase AmpD
MALTLPAICPIAGSFSDQNFLTRGGFVVGRPTGVTIHYTADRDVSRLCHSLRAKGYGYHLLVLRDGSLLQTARMDLRVDHAGPAAWSGSSPNRNHIAVAVVSWGRLAEKNGRILTWSNEEVARNETAYRPYNIAQTVGLWDIATEDQAGSLFKFLDWTCEQGILPGAICGHDEAALPIGRKIDPGGVLPWAMKDLRQSLKALALSRLSQR